MSRLRRSGVHARGRQMRRAARGCAKRDRYVKSRAAPFLAFYLDLAGMQLYQFAHQSESNAGPLKTSTPRALHAMETIEQLFDLTSRNAGTRIAHRQPCHALTFAQRDFYLTRERELERVGDQVENDLLPHVAIDIGNLAQWRRVDYQP